MKKGKTLGILGGMGPMATAIFFAGVVRLTEAEFDQGHIPSLIDSNCLIPDRSAYLLGRGENPLAMLLESASRLKAWGADFLAMPCNTAHVFYDEIQKQVNIPFINMIEETVAYVDGVTRPPKNCNSRAIGLLATEGLCKSGLYDTVAKKYGIEILKPNPSHQNTVSELIKRIKKGHMKFDTKAVASVVDSLQRMGAAAIVLGCTELSVVGAAMNIDSKFVDPMEILAKSVVVFAGKKVKEDKEGGGEIAQQWNPKE